MKKSIAPKLFVGCFCVFLAGVAALTLLLPKADSSYYENRSLAKAPEFTWEDFLSGEYFSQWETYLTDHVALRSYLMKVQTFLQLHILHQPVVSDVVTDSDVLLGYHGYGTWSMDYAADSAKTAAEEPGAWQAAAEDWGGQVYYLGLPEQYSYFEDRYPDYMENRSFVYPPIEEAMEEAMGEVGVPFLSMYTRYREEGCPREYYFATDHHYTIYGALRACQEALTAINDTQGYALYIPQEEDLAFTTLPNPFLGSRNRKLFGLEDKGDLLTVAEYKEAVPFTRSDNGKPSEASLLALPATEEETVTYNAFMGGDIGETVIDTHREDLPTAVVIGESFTNALETLLYASFDEVHSIDPRHFDGDISTYLAELQPEVILIVRDNSAYFS